MPGQNQVTVTAYSGPGKLNTATLITQVNEIRFDLAAGVLFVGTEDFPSPREFALSDVDTVTFSINGQNYTVTVS